MWKKTFQQHVKVSVGKYKTCILGVAISCYRCYIQHQSAFNTNVCTHIFSTSADIFADDTTIGTSSHSIDTMVETLTTDLQNVLSSYNSNNMSLNVSKTKLMYISSRHRQQILSNCDHDISICDSKIQVSSVEKLLGVTISNTLCWDAHIDQLIKKCYSYLFLLSRIKVFLSRRNGIQLLHFPHLDFCCIIWGNCSSTLEDKLVKFQKRAARVILDCDFYTPSS